MQQVQQPAWPPHLASQIDTPSTLSPTSCVPPVKVTEYAEYYAIFTPLGKICLKEFPMSLDWDDDDYEEKGKDQNKGEDKKDSEKKTTQTSPRFFVTTTLTLQPPESSIEQCSKRSSVTPEKEKEEHRHDTLMTLLGHENQDTSEDID